MICPRLYAVAAAQPGKADRAARTASRTSLREASAAFARKSPEELFTGYERPLSLRGKAPPMNSLYVLRTSTREVSPSDLVGKVGLQPVAAALAAVPRFLVAAERRRRVELVERVGP